MIEIARQLPNSDAIQRWLEAEIKTHLKPDVSNYAKGRLRVWLQYEPSLTSPTKIFKGLATDYKIIDRLKELIQFDFDFCLVTYSGDSEAIGISPHRDASYADYEAYALHISGECKFDYWCGRNSFTAGKNEKEYNPKTDTPTHSLLLNPGDLVHFNCKNIHAASPSVARWNMNFWKEKPNAIN